MQGHGARGGGNRCWPCVRLDVASAASLGHLVGAQGSSNQGSGLGLGSISCVTWPPQPETDGSMPVLAIVRNAFWIPELSSMAPCCRTRGWAPGPPRRGAPDTLHALAIQPAPQVPHTQ